MAFISILVADLALTGIGIAIIGMFCFGTALVIAAVIAKLVRRSRLKKGKTVYGKTVLISNIATAAGLLCMLPFIALLIKIL